MTPLEVIANIRRSGGSITVNDGKLKVVAPVEVVNALRPALAEFKPILLSLLAAQPAVETDLDKPDWWNPGLSDQDNRDLDQFFGHSSDPERRAIQWVESLSPSNSRAVVSAAIVQLDSITGRTDQTREQSEQSEQAAACSFSGTGREQSEQSEQTFEPVPCAKCGSISAWWDLADGRHCDQCDPPIRSQFIASRVKLLLADYAVGKYPTNGRAIRRIRGNRQPIETNSKDRILSRIFTAWQVEPVGCQGHKERENWIETEGNRGAVRVTCSLCGGFVGYQKRAKSIAESDAGSNQPKG